MGNVFCIVFHYPNSSLFDLLINLATLDVPDTFLDISDPQNYREIRNFLQLFPPLYGKVLGVHVQKEMFLSSRGTRYGLYSIQYALSPSPLVVFLSLSHLTPLLQFLLSRLVSPLIYFVYIYFSSLLSFCSLSLT